MGSRVKNELYEYYGLEGWGKLFALWETDCENRKSWRLCLIIRGRLVGRTVLLALVLDNVLFLLRC